MTTQPTRTDWGLLILRLAVGGLMLFHGVHKVLHGIAPIEGMLDGHGLPAALAYGAYVGEVVAPILVLVGFLARLGGALIAVNMVFAICLAHAQQVFSLQETGAWAIELPLLFLLGGLAIALTGPGAIAPRAGRGW